MIKNNIEDKYTMSLSLNVLNHLGINLYSNIPSVISEIVANAWDADASEVHIHITDNNDIIIQDNGSGMDIDDINNKFLNVGYQRREHNEAITAKYSRPVMGRKGIGKLSMFSIANDIDIYTSKNGSINGFNMNLEKIKDAIKYDGDNVCYHPDSIIYEGDNFIGTKIILKDLKKRISSITPQFLIKRIARRFSVLGNKYKFKVYVNDQEVQIKDRDYFHKVEYVWYIGCKEDDNEYKPYFENVKKEKYLSGEVEKNKNYYVSGWIGTVKEAGALKDGDENLNKIILIVRGKLGQENILDIYNEGGLYSKYLIGEIHADFFEDDNCEDMATSSRQEYNVEDERFEFLKNFIKNVLKEIQKEGTSLRNEMGVEEAISIYPSIKKWMDELKGDDKKYAKSILGNVNQIIVDEDKKKEILKYSILAFEKLKYNNNLSKIDDLNLESLDNLMVILNDIDDIEATLYYQIINERINVIKKFQEITEVDVLENVIQQYLFEHLWLLDPAWERASSTEYMEKRVKNALSIENINGLTDEEIKGRLDIGYKTSAGKHIIIELKRYSRRVSRNDIYSQITKYHDAIRKLLSNTGQENVPFEIVVVLGKLVEDLSQTELEKFYNSIASYNTRVVYYDNLIENANKAYKDYIEANKKVAPLIDMFDEISKE
ncbi:BbrUII/HgiDII family restriction enzyme [Anaerofustis stercorihominis]|uniref:BbrUII/HgiDII family restriction enzyme n=1 Tax=Anaerofustis stercorihominis TaxID=214853 RepID=UPI001106B1E7|nr:ATP-binding protein [Anaerofustis stercorihominis]